jgi:hypothetical protein
MLPLFMKLQETGPKKLADVNGPSTEVVNPVPTNVVMIPELETARILWLLRSTMYPTPVGVTQTSRGMFRRALVEGPPSPVLPSVPVPA